MPLTSRLREINYNVILVKEHIKNGGKDVGRHLPYSPPSGSVLLLQHGVRQNAVHKVVFIRCVDVLNLLCGGTAEADLCRSTGSCSIDVVPCLAAGETKLALLRAWRTIVQA
jgi:hypothetical protein